MMPIEPLAVTAYTLNNALGAGRQATLKALRERRTGLRQCDLRRAEIDTWIGRVDGIENRSLPPPLAAFDCRNNRLAWWSLRLDDFSEHIKEAIHRYGGDRIGVFLGTSTSGIAATEEAYERRDTEGGRLPADFSPSHTHNIHSLTWLVRSGLGLTGPGLAISTACSSSAKVFAAAHRYISAGLCDAALIGGVDTLCLTTLYGFNSLELISSSPCRPWDLNRDGINIGEAAGFALLEKPHRNQHSTLLLGYGESSDAHHISTPHPEGAGAAIAMRKAIQSAALKPFDIDYVNLHGTATRNNDASEDNALISVFGGNTACSSTKGWVGHTLGAAGITEALFSLIALEEEFIPGTLNTSRPDPALRSRLIIENERRAPTHILSNSFGFGGNNCSLLFGVT